MIYLLVPYFFMKKVSIYSTPTCVYCNMAKEYFRKNGIPFTDYNVAVDFEKRQEMIEKSEQMGVPVIEIDGDVIVGFDQDRLKDALGL